MTNSEIFKAAHELTSKTVKTGDNYQITFGAALKIIRQHGLEVPKRVKPATKAPNYSPLRYWVWDTKLGCAVSYTYASAYKMGLVIGVDRGQTSYIKDYS